MSNINKQFKKENKVLSPKIDVIFQALFGEVGSEKITKSFLESILKEKIDSIDLSKNPILRRQKITDKLGVLDVIAKINGKENCNIEIQITPQPEIIDRILYYWGRIYTRQIKKSEKYDSLERTIQILIIDFKIKELEGLEYLSKWKIIEEKQRKQILTDKLEIDIIELPKIEKEQGEDKLLDWLYFIQDPESERVIEKMQEDEILKEASEKLHNLSDDEVMQRMADWREKAILDANTNYSVGYKEGVEQSKKEIIIEMLKNNIDLDIIEKVTKIEKSRIEEIKKEMNI